MHFLIPLIPIPLIAFSIPLITILVPPVIIFKVCVNKNWCLWFVWFSCPSSF